MASSLSFKSLCFLLNAFLIYDLGTLGILDGEKVEREIQN